MENELNVNPESSEEIVNPIVLERQLEQLKLEQNLPFGIAFGAVAALIGALLWAVITVLTNYQIGYMAVAVGFLVGYAVRLGGKGIDKTFGIVGAVLALLGCLLGNFFSQIGFIAQYLEIGYFEVFSAITFGTIMDVMIESFSPIDLLFYAIAIYEGYRFSFRKLENS